MKGIILAGGSGTRLFPATTGISKQMLPVYDKPMIYYPLSTLMLAGIREILVITTPRDDEAFEALLGDGSKFGVEIKYVAQPNPGGLAEAFIFGKDFIEDDRVALILGDNIFYGDGMSYLLTKIVDGKKKGATIFGYQVKDPQRYGVVELDKEGDPVSIEEKPEKPKSELAVPGLYFYDNQVIDIASKLKPSERGELEITDVNRVYMEQEQLNVEKLGRGIAWLDTGTSEALHQASGFIQAIQERQGLMVGCLEELAYRQEWISKDQLTDSGMKMRNSEYGQYLLRLARQ